MPTIGSLDAVEEHLAGRATGLSELPQFLGRIAQFRQEFIVYDDGFRGWTYSYAQVWRLATAFATRLRQSGIRKGDRVAIWSESRPGWIIALWACLREGAVVVPVEPQSSADLFGRIQQKVRPGLILLGDRVAAQSLADQIPVWRLSEAEKSTGEAVLEPAPPAPDDIAEIVFTSGTTGDPKGVIITHRNLAAQIPPIEEQIAPYRKYVRPFAPIRILNLLPMSHLFGQSLATFVPPLIPASVVFISSTTPREIVRQIRSRRVTVLVAVPKALDLLREYLVRRFPETLDTTSSGRSWPIRWWRFRAVHRMFGWKFCCVVSGGAPLSAELENFWSNLGFVVVQGYGLTETAPVISFSHPFHVQPGTTGHPLRGIDVKIAEDGEVLVRGDNVTPGYFEAPQETSEAFDNGWFHTGDFGLLDSQGNLLIRGRKKDMIVTPEGLKIFPEDVEAVLDHMPGVRESAVIGTDQVHVVLVLDPGVDAEEVVSHANALLENHQRIRSFSIWAGAELPRTATTRKLRRAAIAGTIARGSEQAAASPHADLVALVQKYAPGRAVNPASTIDELGLSSLDRVELMMDLETKLGASVDESAFSAISKVADLAKPVMAAEPPLFPAYNRTWIAKLIRGISMEGLLLPLTRLLAPPKVSGLENLAALRGPVIFAANHQSHLDTPLILASLPWRQRRRIAPAMWKEYFSAHFHPEGRSLQERWTNNALYFLITLLFNGFPIPQTEAGARESIRYIGDLAEEGWSILIFPEGERTLTGEIGRFLPGVGMIASRLQLPVVPVRLTGVNRVLPAHTKWPRPGRVEISFGQPMDLRGESYAALTRQVEQAVRNL